MSKSNWVSRAVGLIEQIDDWLIRPNALKDLTEYVEARVVGQDPVRGICANTFVYLNTVARSLPVNNNMLITAQSGTGKTETYRAIRDYFRVNIPELPVFMVDSTQLTPSGYKGSNLEDMFFPLFLLGTDKPPAIVFLDEIDKRIMPDGASNGLNSSVQYNLLSILEDGNITTIGSRGERKRIYTSNIMFVGLGSFNAFREEKGSVKSFGFNATAQKIDDMMFTPELLLEAGAVPELVGRFPFIVNYGELSDESIKKIIHSNIEDLSYIYDCDIAITKKYSAILRELSRTKFGCRAMKNKLQSDVLNIYTQAMHAKHLKNEVVIKIVLDEKPRFTWRPYNEEELRILEQLNVLNDVDNTDNKRAQENAE